MAKRPANLIAYAQALLGWPIVEGSQVITTSSNMGGDNDDVERTVEAGAKAEVIAIDWFGNDQRLAVTIEIEVPEKDSDGDPNSITAVYDEADDEDGHFAFVPATVLSVPTPKQLFKVNVRGIATATIEVEAETKEDALKAAGVALDEQVIEWSVDSEEVEGLA